VNLTSQPVVLTLDKKELIMLRIAILVAMALAFTLPAQAKSKNTHKYEDSLVVDKSQGNVERREFFGPAERNMIRAHLQEQQRRTAQQNVRGLPPGLQKKVARGKALPPGWQKKIAPGQSLDYQVYREGESLPDSLLRRLPPPPVGSEILQVEDKIFRLDSATRTILDVFDLIPTR
jgi:hypothetical protein